MRVLALVCDPLLSNGQTLHQRFNWVSPVSGTRAFASDLEYASGQEIHLIIERIGIPKITTRRFIGDYQWDTPGQAYTMLPDQFADTFTRFGWGTGPPWPGDNSLHIESFLADNNIIPRINDHAIDEVWYVGPPYPRTWEGCMVSWPDDQLAYHCHDAIVRHPDARRRFVIHNFNPENWNPHETFFHRIEKIMTVIYNKQWDSQRTPTNYFELFVATDKSFPGHAQIGNAHFMPNTTEEYNRFQPNPVPSHHEAWYDYPEGFPLDLNELTSQVNADTWSSYSHPIVWQWAHIPSSDGIFDGRHANWWKYILDVNDMAGRDTPFMNPIKQATTPQPPPAPPTPPTPSLWQPSLTLELPDGTVMTTWDDGRKHVVVKVQK